MKYMSGLGIVILSNNSVKCGPLSDNPLLLQNHSAASLNLVTIIIIIIFIAAVEGNH